MADPISAMAIIGAGASAAGAVTGAIGSEYKGQAESNMYNYQAGVAKINADMATQDSNYALASGEVQAEQSGMRTGQEIGATRAAFGASNITGASKSAVITSDIEVGQQQDAIIRANAAKRAYGFQVSSASDTAQAGVDVAAGQNSITAGNIGATSSIIGGVGSVASKWAQMGPAFGGGGGSLGSGGMGLPTSDATGGLY